MKSKYDLIIVQPIISSYRVPYFRKISQHWKTLFLSSDLNVEEGFGTSEVTDFFHNKTVTYHFFNKKLNYQKGVLTNILKFRPVRLYIGADSRAIAYWLSLILCNILGIKVYSHGQGAYRKLLPNLVDKLKYRLMVLLSEKYICYTKLSMESLVALGINKKYLAVADNTLLNKCPVYNIPFEDFENKKGILFIGRLREQVGLELLFEAIAKLNKDSNLFELHIIGDGEFRKKLESLALTMQGIHFHGKVFDNNVIADISRKCVLGIHAGNAGLSVVHYMSLSLVPIVHNKIHFHMGPEPSYIYNKVNGFTFEYECVDSLSSTILGAFKDKEKLYEISRSAYATYQHLSSPDLGDKLLEIMGN